MTEPSPRSSRIALAAGIAAAIALAVGGYIAGRTTSAPPPAPEPPIEPAAEQPPPGAKVLPQPLGRSELLAAIAAAADAYASGRVGSPENIELVGRRFEIRIPFGCYGASVEGGAALQWSYDAEKQALRISAAPEVWTDVPWLRQLVGEQIEAIEGFWVPQPWSTSEACPTPEARMIVPPILPAPRQTVGLAQFFEAGASRVHRRNGKPYTTVDKVALDELNATEGFRLVLSGRVDALPSGQPVGCHSLGAEFQPVCIVAVKFDRVAVENPLSGKLLAEWSA